MGRIGLAVSPADPNVVYATIEAADGKGGIFRSSDKGATWERRNEFDQGAMYYARIVADPKNADRIFVMNVSLRESLDGGKTLHKVEEDESSRGQSRDLDRSGQHQALAAGFGWRDV